MKTLMLSAAALLLAAPLAAAAVAPEDRLARLTDGRIAGKPVDCLPLSTISSVQIVDGTALVYRRGDTLYVNRPVGGARQLDRDDILVVNQFGTQLCRQDWVRTVDRTSGFPNGVVTLGRFVPYARAN